MFIETTIRKVAILYSELAEPVPPVLLHTTGPNVTKLNYMYMLSWIPRDCVDEWNYTISLILICTLNLGVRKQ